jgi:hypothetical protein
MSTSDLGGKNYTLGRGRVLFDRFANGVTVCSTTKGEGERYFGNTPEFGLTSETESLEHYDSDRGVKVKDDSVELSRMHSGTFSCDNIDAENLALYFLGDAVTLTQAAATGVVQLIPVAKQRRFYQLGESATTPAGVRNVSNVVVKKGASFATTVSASGNYEVDAVRGRIYVEADAPDIDDVELQITFDVAASTRERVVSSTNSIYGAVRFLGDNAKGANRDYYFPYVKISPDGDYALKGDDWQTMGFTFEVMKKASNIELLYIDGQPTLTV